MAGLLASNLGCEISIVELLMAIVGLLGADIIEDDF